MNFNNQEEIDRELEIMENVLGRHEYPIFSDVEEMVEDFFESYANLDYQNYECMATIWYNMHDRDAIERMGEEIHRRGGLQAMQTHYYIFLHVFRRLFRDELDAPEVLIAWRTMRTLINNAWDGVGDWRV
jgi:hypothetical protein